MGATLLGAALLGPAAPPRPFPIERGADELRAALKDAQVYLEATRPSLARFAGLAQPYAPLDLELRGTHATREAAEVKNFFLGAAGYSAGLPPDQIQELVRAFFKRHGRLAGKAAWLASLPEQRALVARFRALPQLGVLAQWGSEDYRVGDLFKVGDQFFTATPSPTLGLVPWGTRVTLDDPKATGAAVVRDVAAAAPLLVEMRRLRVLALVRMPSGAVRVIQDGVADNEVGTLFVVAGGAVPKKGEELTDGKPVLHAEAVADGVYYYLAG